ncbi:NUDIX hydrolase [Croceitalea rosinachiae]|uniref:CoA pyrophosphatase n=1 Tax=Croceitalea rosinachiae TaxID=3075596 RepID=A0ABU3AEC9_9FLAO|nr:CoA pyrophosphatase [Croceitalea sp. F388]MDT0608546.1 CoA pyrophosphatase [Croceitalea sp. F388]
MNFTDFCKQLIKIKNLPLPGDESHYKMEPLIRREWRESHKINNKSPRQAAVMALFYPNADEKTQLLLILRKTYNGVHSNQIGFPGGKVEKDDKSLVNTALRETYEEVGVLQDDVDVLKTLTEIYIPPSNFLVQPYIGLYANPKPFVIQEEEVEALVEVKLADFLNEHNKIEQQLSTSYAKEILVPAFKLNGYVVWGATAMMLNEIKDLLKKVL